MLDAKELEIISKMLDEAYPNPLVNVLLWAIAGLEDAGKASRARGANNIADADDRFINAMQKAYDALNDYTTERHDKALREYYAKNR